MIPFRWSCGVCFYGNYDKKKKQRFGKKKCHLDWLGQVGSSLQGRTFILSFKSHEKVLIKKFKNIRNYF